MTDISANPTAGWNFDNSYARLPEIFYSSLPPVPVREPQTVILNDRLAAELGLNPDWLHSEEAASVFGGNTLPEGSRPLAQAYAGHQFGGFNRLGDGRAVLLGEQLTPSGHRIDIQLKGSGRTPFSRGGDGRAALGPMLREYIISEAMYALGIPTTRSLAVTATGEPIRREKELPGAVLTRTAASHLRVGTFQYAAQWGGPDAVRTLADYAIERHYPEIGTDEAVEDGERYASFLQSVVERQAALIAQWMQVGFIHGVMNTDNMTISGESIDYGPCAFLDAYDPSTVFSSIDTGGRYAYGNQPPIALWNLTRLAETLIPLLDEDSERAVEIAQDILGRFERLYLDAWFDGMRAKLGLFGREEEDEKLIADLLDLVKAFRADYTNTFVALTFDRGEIVPGQRTLAGSESQVRVGAPPTRTAAIPGADALIASGEYRVWRERWQQRLERQTQSREESVEMMRRHNPAVIPRNHRVEEALAAASNADDYGPLHRLLAALADPYAHSAEQAQYAQLPPDAGEGYRTFCGT
ncbi:protein adenylyltransferase SelO [Saccharibacillus deserti]|uniref:protein adenylyltransferase SelO n=1 Tax=Saccharibacillus deserti TaxID=1634444 RepID=UPI00155173BB|nr:YdiU family protein [Saccharibacillus deserti]